MNRPSSKTLLIGSLAGMLSVPLAMAARGGAAAEEGESIHCYGVNKCKGVGDCNGEGHDCSGLNACSRQGFLSMDKDLCLKIDGGRLTPAE